MESGGLYTPPPRTQGILVESLWFQGIYKEFTGNPVHGGDGHLAGDPCQTAQGFHVDSTWNPCRIQGIYRELQGPVYVGMYVGTFLVD